MYHISTDNIHIIPYHTHPISQHHFNKYMVYATQIYVFLKQRSHRCGGPMNITWNIL